MAHHVQGEVQVPAHPDAIDDERGGESAPIVIVHPAEMARNERPQECRDGDDGQEELRRVRLERYVARAFRRDVELERLAREIPGRGKDIRPEARHVVALRDQHVARPARQELEARDREDHVGHEPNEQRCIVHLHGKDAEQEVEHRREVEDEALDAVQIHDHRREIQDPLLPGEAGHEQWIHLAQDLHGSLTPPQALHVVLGGRGGREAIGQRLAVVERFPPARMELHGRLHVLRDRERGKATDLVERRAAKHAAAAAEEGGVVPVLSRLDEREEDPVLLPHLSAFRVHDVREGIGVVEILRRLHEREPGLVEVPEQAIQDVRQRNVVRVELEDEVTARDSEGVVEVPSLRVCIALAPDVADTELLGHRLHLIALTVIEHIGLVWIPDRARANGRAPEQLERLVVACDEDVHLQPIGRRRWLAMHEPPRREDEERHADQPERLGHDQDEREQRVFPVYRVRPAPVDPVDAVRVCGERDHADCQLLRGWEPGDRVGGESGPQRLRGLWCLGGTHVVL